MIEPEIAYFAVNYLRKYENESFYPGPSFLDAKLIIKITPCYMSIQRRLAENIGLV